MSKFDEKIVSAQRKGHKIFKMEPIEQTKRQKDQQMNKNFLKQTINR